MNRTNNKRQNGAKQKPRNGNSNNGKQNGNGNGNGKRYGRSNGRGGVTATMPLSSAYNNVRSMNNNVRVERGSDFISSVQVRGNPSRTERILIAQDVSPSSFPGTRITQLSQLYERYRFRSVSLRWVPAVPATLACQFLLYVDTDPLDDPTEAATSEVLIRQATAQTGAQQWNFNLAKRIPMALRKDDQMYYTGDTKINPRFSLMGRAYLIQVSNPVNFNGEPITNNFDAGTLYIDWVCEFQTPQINPAGYLSTTASLSQGQRGTIQFSPFGGTTSLSVSANTERASKQFVYSITQAFQADWTNSTSVTADGNIYVRQEDGDAIIQSNRLAIGFIASTDAWYVAEGSYFAFGQFDRLGAASFPITTPDSFPAGSNGTLTLTWRIV